jgi:signal transduction histidine kinase
MVRRLAGPSMWLLVWGPILVITAIHFGTDPSQTWVHGILRRVYYLPIIVAAFRERLMGGMAAALVTTAIYLPHAFTTIHHHDPAPWLDKALEIVLYNVVGAVAGYLAAQGRRRERELRSALDSRETLQRELVRAGRLSALGEVVAGIAHELRNPLHALEGSAEIIEAAIPPDGPVRRMWTIHRAELERLDRVSGQFLGFARPSEPQLRTMDLADVARRVAELVAAQAREQGVAVVVVVPEQPVPVRGDPDQLAQVGLNLALNGIRALARGGGGRMWLSVHAADPARVQLRVENDGPPIPSDDLERLFDPFFSGDEEGVGLGLSISSRIAEQHEGWLEAENAGPGVRFTLSLPAAR